MGRGSIAPSFLTSVLDGGEWSASPHPPSRFILTDKAPGTHRIGGWVGPKAGLEAVEMRKILKLPGIEARPSSP
jgi:hypothetical protein